MQEKQTAAADCTLKDKCGDKPDAPKIRFMPKKMLKGHINKVNSVHFAADNRHCVTGSLDGKLIIWDTWTANKVQVKIYYYRDLRNLPVLLSKIKILVSPFLKLRLT